LGFNEDIDDQKVVGRRQLALRSVWAVRDSAIRGTAPEHYGDREASAVEEVGLACLEAEEFE
jgi:1,2-phenylacetyl-CoA epoxidase PaaB subunit